MTRYIVLCITGALPTGLSPVGGERFVAAPHAGDTLEEARRTLGAMLQNAAHFPHVTVGTVTADRAELTVYGAPRVLAVEGPYPEVQS